MADVNTNSRFHLRILKWVHDQFGCKVEKSKKKKKQKRNKKQDVSIRQSHITTFMFSNALPARSTVMD